MSKPDEYKNIGDSFETGFETISDKELIYKLNRHSGTSAQESIEIEMTRRLKQEIEELNKASSKQSEVMIRLTRWIMWLTIALGIIAFIQLILLVKQIFY